MDFPTLIWLAATVISGLIGGLFTWWSSQRLEAQRAARENVARLQIQRRVIYAKLLRVTDLLWARRSASETVPPRLVSQFSATLAEVELIAPAQTRKLALMMSHMLRD